MEKTCEKRRKQEGHDGPVLLHWLIGEIPNITLLGNWFKT